jgi:hypothetical protein
MVKIAAATTFWMKILTCRRYSIWRRCNYFERIGAMKTLSQFSHLSNHSLSWNGKSEKEDPTVNSCHALATMSDAIHLELHLFAKGERSRRFRGISHQQRI